MRQLLTVLLPLLLPFIGYAIYVKFARQKQARSGQDPSSHLQETPWIWILAIGCVLMTASLLFFEQQVSYAPGTELAPPSWVDGEIVPSHPAGTEADDP